MKAQSYTAAKALIPIRLISEEKSWKTEIWEEPEDTAPLCSATPEGRAIRSTCQFFGWQYATPATHWYLAGCPG